MKLNSETISYLFDTIIPTAKLVGIDNVIIEPNLVRGMDEQQTAVIYQNRNIPKLSFDSIGLNRIDALMARFDIIHSQPKFSIEGTIDTANNFTRSLTLKTDTTEIEYRCANPTTIKAPKQINDTMAYRFVIDTEAINVLSKGQGAMRADNVSLLGNKGVSFELADSNGEVFKHKFASSFDITKKGVSPTFVYKYPVKTLLAILRNNGEQTIEIGEKGLLCISRDSLHIYLLPQV